MGKSPPVVVTHHPLAAMETLSLEPGTDVINRALLRTVCLLLLSFSPSAQAQTVSVEERETRRIVIRQELNELTKTLREGVAAELRERDEQALAAERTKEFAPWISRIHERIRAKVERMSRYVLNR